MRACTVQGGVGLGGQAHIVIAGVLVADVQDALGEGHHGHDDSGNEAQQPKQQFPVFEQGHSSFQKTAAFVRQPLNSAYLPKRMALYCSISC